MNKSVSLFLLLFVINTNIFAQFLYKPGYVILVSGDTLSGEIGITSDGKISKACTFRTKGGSDIETFNPQEVKEFRFDNGGYYVSEEIKSGSRVFLRYLVKGKMDLYYNGSRGRAHYYMRKEGDIIRELPMQSENVTVDGAKYTNPQVILKVFLQNITKEAPELAGMIQNTRVFDKNKLTEIAVSYHNSVCFDEKCIVYK
jgi:hypothetical protein